MKRRIQRFPFVELVLWTLFTSSIIFAGARLGRHYSQRPTNQTPQLPINQRFPETPPRQATPELPSQKIISELLKDQNTQNTDIVKEAKLAGAYSGLVRGNVIIPGTLIIRDALEKDGSNLEISVPEAGQNLSFKATLTGRFLPDRTIEARLDFLDNSLRMGPDKTMKLQVVKHKDGIRLMSGSTVVFASCLPYNGCLNQPGCEPCTP